MKNKEKILQKSKEYGQRNKEQIRAYQNRYLEEHPEMKILSSAKRTAIKRGVDFNIDLSDILIPIICPYLKTPIELRLGQGRQSYNPSIDRIDPLKGYIKGNVQIISDLANRMKTNATKGELLQFAKSILEQEGYTITDGFIYNKTTDS